MKKVLIFIILSIFLFGLASCDSINQPQEKNDDNQNQSDTSIVDEILDDIYNSESITYDFNVDCIFGDNYDSTISTHVEKNAQLEKISQTKIETTLDGNTTISRDANAYIYEYKYEGKTYSKVYLYDESREGYYVDEVLNKDIFINDIYQLSKDILESGLGDASSFKYSAGKYHSESAPTDVIINDLEKIYPTNFNDIKFNEIDTILEEKKKTTNLQINLKNDEISVVITYEFSDIGETKVNVEPLGVLIEKPISFNDIKAKFSENDKYTVQLNIAYTNSYATYESTDYMIFDGDITQFYNNNENYYISSKSSDAYCTFIIDEEFYLLIEKKVAYGISQEINIFKDPLLRLVKESYFDIENNILVLKDDAKIKKDIINDSAVYRDFRIYYQDNSIVFLIKVDFVYRGETISLEAKATYYNFGKLSIEEVETEYYYDYFSLDQIRRVYEDEGYSSTIQHDDFLGLDMVYLQKNGKFIYFSNRAISNYTAYSNVFYKTNDPHAIEILQNYNWIYPCTVPWQVIFLNFNEVE